ncbi:FACT complex subunit SPT16 [Sistotremastrum suecicum HHB10207 ss-3]|uniref:FACT complex subunit n=1 Tax=Sistotremastrum suecicum HHB10207 ss-3 TaxID=1314776 RepID=A0A166IUX9_9AGAM|nr:FACT complex subunit SPT16 [Sistotremastrum suecicum HHB10207 ss-3]
MQVTLNATLFAARVQLLLNAWNGANKSEEFGSLSEADALFLPAGDVAGEDEPMRKGTAFQTWLVGYEFPSTFFFFEKNKITFLCSASKAKILSQLKASNPPVPIEILAQAKPKDPPTDAMARFVAAYTAHKRVATLTKEVHSGKLVEDWKSALAASDAKVDVVDMSGAISAVMAVKDEEELRSVRLASNLASTLLTHHIAPKLETILDKEAKISHAAFAEQIESRLGSGEGENAKGPDMKVWSKGKGLFDVDWASAEFTYSPIIQSQSTSTGFDLRSTAESSQDNLAHKGFFLVALGMRYKGYCANIGRSFAVDPTKEQESVYALLLSLQTEVLSKMKDGTPAKDVYNHALAVVQREKPDLVKHLPKSIGFGMGLEFRDSNYVLNAKNERPLKSGMIFNLSLGFQNVPDANGKTYALHIVDTVKVTSDKGVCLTDGTKSIKDVMFYLNGPSDDDEPKASSKPKKSALPTKASPVKNKVVGNKVLRGKTRSAAQEDAINSAAAKLATHQRELHEMRQRDGLAKYAEEGSGHGGKEVKGWKRFQSYKGEGGLPREAETLRIWVDRKNQTVILPINGFAVPFHINTIKNAVKNDEGDYTQLRIIFQTPGQLAGKKEDTPFEDPEATFIRSASYRSTDGHRFDTLCSQINDLKKEVNKREQQKKEMADVVEQDNLVELKGRRPIKLPEAFVRPALDGKRLPGEVEIHVNGLRYQSLSGQKIDLLFSNIKHIFFQPCDHELLVIIHIHLKAPIMIGKKKAKDVQFYREASDVQFDETGNRKRKYRYGDEDEIELEQTERRRRQALNKEFKFFGEKLSEAASTSTGDTVELDIPFRDLAFEGVPFKMNVKLQPTTECLVHLSDPPFLVITLSEVEIVSLERVQFGLKQFDMVIIFNDFSRSPQQINSIPTSQLDDVKNWLE